MSAKRFNMARAKLLQEQGAGPTEIARILGVSYQSVYDAFRRERDPDYVARKRQWTRESYARRVGKLP